MTASPEEAREFAHALRSLLEWVHGDVTGRGNDVVNLVRAHLGAERVTRSVVTRELPPYEHVNLQAALNAWTAGPGRTVEVQGVTVPPHWSGLSLQQLLIGEGLPPLRLSSPELIDLPSGPDTTLACVQNALLLVTDAYGRYVLLISGPERHQAPSLTVEVAGLAVGEAQAVLAELAELRSQLNVYRGQVVELGTDPSSGLQLAFAALPLTRRSDVVLPEKVLQRVERHTIEVAAHREALLAAGQHLKRGLLLFGPPGTGKTHTTRYVIGRMTGYTVLMLSGRSLHLVGAITALARTLQPAAVVLEDVDLVAEERGFGPGSGTVLFDLLDAMDGAAADADLLFMLTTNRADLLEPALAARPGRIDVAVEIGLPDADARRRLLQLYGEGVPLQLTAADVETAVERTEGTTASFLKELVRRAVLEALRDGSPTQLVTGEHLAWALEDLLDSSQQVTRALLGMDSGGAATPAGPPLARPMARPMPGRAPHPGRGWMLGPGAAVYRDGP